jgi:hypothetical protein
VTKKVKASRTERLDDGDKQRKWSVVAQLFKLSELGDRNQAREWFRHSNFKKIIKDVGFDISSILGVVWFKPIPLVDYLLFPH